ncbi:MAG: Z1 domain-containing protein [Tepidisphaeraceae bacterium]
MSQVNPITSVVTVPSASDPSGDTWTPFVGEETLELLDRLQRSNGLDDAGKAKLQAEGLAILAKCVNPARAGARSTGLVLGQVQSGKTMSFTTVAALARDNGYRLVIVITGTTIPLLGQSESRLRQDLALDSVGRRWRHVPVEPRAPMNGQMLVDVLDAWNDPGVPSNRRQTLLITVMKNHLNVRKLRMQLELLAARLVDAPGLIIDDEGDQASLNTRVAVQGESAVYRELLALKRALPRHTFLQYTATPQALLLINIINTLSPTFCETLVPGDGYTGGQTFFIENPGLTRDIPQQDIGTRQSPITDPPDSLFEALRLFFLGVAAGCTTYHGGNRSMLVHPSRTTAEHASYHQWILQTKESWKRLLQQPSTDPDRIELINEFRTSYEDLARTVPDLASFDDLATRLLMAVRETQVEEVNRRGGATPQIRWNDTYAWILVGGTAMDRGFTVRGLTVTYMPRGLGGQGQGNADTVQQRARFFGYKRGYLGYCRVYLEAGVRQAFRAYVEHEQDVRTRLVSHRMSGRPLTEWPRAFLLDTAMRPTRNNVIDVAWTRQSIGQGWFSVDAPHLLPEVVNANRAVIESFRSGISWSEDQGHPQRTDTTKHLVAEVPLGSVYSSLLSQVWFPDFEESQTYLTHLILLSELIQNNPGAMARVYLMSKWAIRERSVNDDDKIVNLFQARSPLLHEPCRGPFTRVIGSCVRRTR